MRGSSPQNHADGGGGWSWPHALVGIAGTAGAWLGARSDRSAQRELARDERTYDRRVSVYLAAIDFLEGQKESFYSI